MYWIEGLTPRRGDKIKSVDLETGDIEYTVWMTEALRVKEMDVNRFEYELKKFNRLSANQLREARVGSSYAPKGTIAQIDKKPYAAVRVWHKNGDIWRAESDRYNYSFTFRSSFEDHEKELRKRGFIAV